MIRGSGGGGSGGNGGNVVGIDTEAIFCLGGGELARSRTHALPHNSHHAKVLSVSRRRVNSRPTNFLSFLFFARLRG